MGKRVKRKYTMTKRLDDAYKNYKKRYRAKAKSLKRRGLDMEAPMMNKKEYLDARARYVEKGRETNINQTIVSDQAYKYSQKTARQFKKVAEEYDLEWKDKSITDLRRGEIDVSSINTMLKEMNPEWSGYDRQQYISYEVFGSE